MTTNTIIKEPSAKYVALRVAEVLDALDAGQRTWAGAVTNLVARDGHDALADDLYDQLVVAGQRALTGRYEVQP